MDLVNDRIVTDNVAGLADFYASVIGAQIVANDHYVDAAYSRLFPLVVTWVMAPTDQPWGTRSAMFRDPDGNLVNLFSRPTQGGPNA